MSTSSFPTTWRDPNYLAAVVGTIATAGLFYYSALVSSAPSTETIAFVLFWILLPATVAHEVARRFL
jgi:hypothetical protein